MKNFKNIFIIFAILVFPVVLYYAMKSASAEDPQMTGAAVTANKPQVIDFSSELCLECKHLKAVLDPLEPKYSDKIIFRKIMVNSASPEEQKLMKKYNVSVVPTLVFLNRQGKVVRVTEGSMPKNELEGYLKKLSNG